MVVADAEARDDLELGEMRQRFLVRRHGVIGNGHAAGVRQHVGGQAFEVGAGFRLVQDELVREAVFQDRPDRSVDQQIDLFGRIIRGSHQFSFPSALSCQRRNTRCETSASSP